MATLPQISEEQESELRVNLAFCLVTEKMLYPDWLNLTWWLIGDRHLIREQPFSCGAYLPDIAAIALKHSRDWLTYSELNYKFSRAMEACTMLSSEDQIKLLKKLETFYGRL